MKRNTYKIAALTTAGILAAVGYSKPWLPYGNPALFIPNMIRNFSQLPLAAKLEGVNQPWSDTYWPSKKGGIAVPYRTGEDAWKSKLPSRDEILSGTVSAETINNLSASAKFDLLRLQYTYPLTRKVLASHSPKDANWWGICHGWSPAALNHPEPQPITVTTADGVTLHFGSSDVKALISYYYAEYAYSIRQVRQLGDRCDGGFLIFKPKSCRRDVNAGALHLALANLIGIKKRGLVGDVTQGKQVWNQPIIGYDSTVLEEKKVDGKVRQVLLKTDMSYVVEVEPSEFPVVGTKNELLESKSYTYWLDLDEKGNITGGKFEGAPSDQSPDFFWTVEPMKFIGEFSALNQIYVPAQ